jgi:hypothetical protein
MKISNIITALIFIISLFSCTATITKEDAQGRKETTAVSIGGTKTRNNIELKANGLKAEQAFLIYEDGSLVPEDNKVKVNQKVRLRLIMSGWKEEEGKVYIGASEKISTSDGTVFLDEKDLFEAYDTAGVTPKDAEVISLSAVITQIDKLYDYFLVSFRVWDKKSNGEVSGSYKLYLD